MLTAPMNSLRNFEPALARRVENMQASEIRELLKLLEQPGVISFAGGIPDPKLFPAKEAAEAYTEALADPAQALQYSVSEGFCRCAPGSLRKCARKTRRPIPTTS